MVTVAVPPEKLPMIMPNVKGTDMWCVGGIEFPADQVPEGLNRYSFEQLYDLQALAGGAGCGGVFDAGADYGFPEIDT